jgi:hypothetical protein
VTLEQQTSLAAEMRQKLCNFIVAAIVMAANKATAFELDYIGLDVYDHRFARNATFC